MDFRYSAEQDDFRASLRGFLRDQAPSPRVREVAAADGHDRRLWKRLCSELELPALHAPPEYGGGGGGGVGDSVVVFGLVPVLPPVSFGAAEVVVAAVLSLAR